MGTVSPAEAIPPETVRLSLKNEGSENLRDGGPEIDLANAHYATSTNLGKQNANMYYELRAHDPAGIPTMISWGMTRADTTGNLRFSARFDSMTLAWIESYGLFGATCSIRCIGSV